MSLDVHGARLEGGPFDGDKGGLIYDPEKPRLPGMLYCRACAVESLPRRCGYADGRLCTGVHWWTEGGAAEKDPEATGPIETYLYARSDFELLEAVYIYGDATPFGIGTLVQEPKALVPA